MVFIQLLYQELYTKSQLKKYKVKGPNGLIFWDISWPIQFIYLFIVNKILF